MLVGCVSGRVRPGRLGDPVLGLRQDRLGFGAPIVAGTLFHRLLGQRYGAGAGLLFDLVRKHEGGYPVGRPRNPPRCYREAITGLPMAAHRLGTTIDGLSARPPLQLKLCVYPRALALRGVTT